MTTYGVSVVFFLYGLTLAPERMKEGLARWQAHIAVVLSTFGLFPLVVLGGEAIVPGLLPKSVMIGFFYVAALPSTVSSSVAMVSLARGNVPIAIFNATISSLIGVFLTPVLMAWYMQSSGAPVPLLPTVGKVVLLVLLPIVIGQVARIWLEGWARRQNRWIKLADRAIIVAIVYGAFCNSVHDGVWSRNDPFVVIEILVGVVALFCIVYALTTLFARLLGTQSGRADRGTVLRIEEIARRRGAAGAGHLCRQSEYRADHRADHALSLRAAPDRQFHRLALCEGGRSG